MSNIILRSLFYENLYNSVLEYSIFLEDMMLDVGDYESIVNADTESGFNQEWKQEFQVTKEDAEYIKEKDNSFTKEFIHTPFWIVLTVVVATIAITLCYIIYVQKNPPKNKKGKLNKIYIVTSKS